MLKQMKEFQALINLGMHPDSAVEIFGGYDTFNSGMRKAYDHVVLDYVKRNVPAEFEFPLFRILSVFVLPIR